MYAALNAGSIGVKFKDVADGLLQAKAHGFRGLDVDMFEVAKLADERGLDAVRAMFESSGVRPAGWALPEGCRGEESEWRRLVDVDLPRLSRVAAAIGCLRCTTFILPCSDFLPFDHNWHIHVERITPVAKVLADHGCRLGLEFVGPKTFWTSQPFPFIHTMEGMLELCRATGSNVGLLLDAWHWYTSHSTLEALGALKLEDIVYVQVSDAPKGIDIDAHNDMVRELPLSTGVIDLRGFMRALVALKYDGPVTCEPFCGMLDGLPSDEDRLRHVAAAMQKTMALAT